MSVVALSFLLLGLRVYLCRKDKTATIDWLDFLRIIFGSLILAGGIAACSVFLLTDPPAFDQLSQDTRVLTGIIVTVVCVAYFAIEVKKFLTSCSNNTPPQGGIAVPVTTVPAQGRSKKEKRQQRTAAGGR
jgi:hypothetical protein